MRLNKKYPSLSKRLEADEDKNDLNGVTEKFGNTIKSQIQFITLFYNVTAFMRVSSHDEGELDALFWEFLQKVAGFPLFLLAIIYFYCKIQTSYRCVVLVIFMLNFKCDVILR